MCAAINLLVVEDSEDEAFLLYSERRSRGLSLSRERVDSKHGMAEALARQDRDLILCDHNMPGFDSGSALAVAQHCGKDVRFIIYSGRISDQQAFRRWMPGFRIRSRRVTTTA